MMRVFEGVDERNIVASLLTPRFNRFVEALNEYRWGHDEEPDDPVYRARDVEDLLDPERHFVTRATADGGEA